jgi:DNA-binding transcriptional LysR family regulator
VLRKAEQRVDVPIAAALVADDAETLVAAAAEDAGIAIATDWLLEKHPARKRLVPVLRDWAVGDDSAVHAVTPAARFLPAKTTVFIDMVTQHLRR